MDMARQMPLLVSAFLAPLVAGCEEAAHAIADAGNSVDGSPGGCEPEFGRAWVFTQLAILPEGEGMDLSGDGVPDNVLGRLAPAANPKYEEGIASGKYIYLIEVPQWQAGTSPGQIVQLDDIDLVFYRGRDADEPADATDNTGGDGKFRAYAEQFDVNCNATSGYDAVRLQGNNVTAHSTSWSFVIPWTGTLEFRNFTIGVEFQDELMGFAGTAGGAWTICGMSNAPFPPGGSYLQAMANMFYISPDIDVDGDGIEQIVGDGNTIKECIDGDGKTTYPGPDCGCLPQMADGFSVGFAVKGVPAWIVGVAAE